MSEFQQDSFITPDSIQQPTRPVRKPSARKPSEQGQTYRIGNRIVRIDAASIDAPPHPHLIDDELDLQTSALDAVAFETIDTQPTADIELQNLLGVIDTHQFLDPPIQDLQVQEQRAQENRLQEMGLGDVLSNDAALQHAAKQMAGLATPETKQETAGSLRIKPAWEVDYFRWPRLTRRLLNTHQELFDQIGGKLLSDLQPTRARIGVCSTFAREGKTTIATCLARWSALSGKSTLLIDADIERPKMTVMCGLDCTFGWQSILDADIPASETMIRSMESGLVFMPSRAGAIPQITDKAIDRLSMITFQMKYEFDVVVIDMGTIDNICAHGTQSMDVLDAMLVTRDPSRTSVGQVSDTRRVLKNIGIKNTYVAQNFARQNIG